jgi:hypothetical protein
MKVLRIDLSSPGKDGGRDIEVTLDAVPARPPQAGRLIGSPLAEPLAGSAEDFRRPSLDFLKQMGEHLHEFLRQGPTGATISAALSTAEPGRADVLVLKLRDLQWLSWEALRSEAGEWLAVGGMRPLQVIRRVVTRAGREIGVRRRSGALKVLLVAAEPPGFPIGVEEEAQAVREELERLGRASAHVRLLMHASLDGWTREMAEGWDVVHFMGHAKFDEEADEACLYFVGGERASASTLWQLMRDSGSSLLVLNACDTARASPSESALSMAMAFAEAGAAQVIGMQFRIYKDDAVLFSREFYRILADGKCVSESLASARTALFQQDLGTGRVSWVCPVLITPNPELALKPWLIPPDRKLEEAYLEGLGALDPPECGDFDLDKAVTALAELSAGEHAVVLCPWPNAVPRGRQIAQALAVQLARQQLMKADRRRRRAECSAVPVAVDIEDLSTETLESLLASQVQGFLPDIDRETTEDWIRRELDDGSLCLLISGFSSTQTRPDAARVLRRTARRLPKAHLVLVLPEETWLRLEPEIAFGGGVGRQNLVRRICALERRSTVFDALNASFWTIAPDEEVESESWAAAGKLWASRAGQVVPIDFFACSGDVRYIDRRLVEVSAGVKQRRHGDESPHRTLRIVDLPRQGPRARHLVVAEGGSGKTTELLRLSWNLLFEDRPSEFVPVFISFGRFAAAREGIVDHLAAELRVHAHPSLTSEQLRQHVLCTPKLFLLLDGLDEAVFENPERAAGALIGLLRDLDGPLSDLGWSLVMTSRPTLPQFSLDSLLGKGFQRLDLSELRREEAESYLASFANPARVRRLLDAVETRTVPPPRHWSNLIWVEKPVGVLGNAMMVHLLSSLVATDWKRLAAEARSELLGDASGSSGRAIKLSRLTEEDIYTAAIHVWLAGRSKHFKSPAQRRECRMLLKVLAAEMVDRASFQLSVEDFVDRLRQEGMRYLTRAAALPSWWPTYAHPLKESERLHCGVSASGAFDDRESLREVARTLLRAPVLVATTPVRGVGSAEAGLQFQHPNLRDLFASWWLQDRLIDAPWEEAGDVVHCFLQQSWAAALKRTARQIGDEAGATMLQMALLLTIRIVPGDEVATRIDQALATIASANIAAQLGPHTLDGSFYRLVADRLISVHHSSPASVKRRLEQAGWELWQVEPARTVLTSVIREALASGDKERAQAAWEFNILSLGDVSGELFDLAIERHACDPDATISEGGLYENLLHNAIVYQMDDMEEVSPEVVKSKIIELLTREKTFSGAACLIEEFVPGLDDDRALHGGVEGWMAEIIETLLSHDNPLLRRWAICQAIPSLPIERVLPLLNQATAELADTASKEEWGAWFRYRETIFVVLAQRELSDHHVLDRIPLGVLRRAFRELSWLDMGGGTRRLDGADALVVIGMNYLKRIRASVESSCSPPRISGFIKALRDIIEHLPEYPPQVKEYFSREVDAIVDEAGPELRQRVKSVLANTGAKELQGPHGDELEFIIPGKPRRPSRRKSYFVPKFVHPDLALAEIIRRWKRLGQAEKLAACFTLGLLQRDRREAGDFLLQIVTGTRSRQVRTLALKNVWSVSRANHRAAMSAIQRVWRSGSADLKVAALSAVRKLGGFFGSKYQTWRWSLIREGLDGDSRVRIAAAHAIASRGLHINKGMEPTLRNILMSGHPAEKAALLYSLLTRSYGSKSWRRWTASNADAIRVALQERKQSVVLRALKLISANGLADSSADLRAGILDLIARGASPVVLLHAVRALSSPPGGWPRWWSEHRRLLFELGRSPWMLRRRRLSEEELEVLSRLLKHKDRGVRMSAAEVLILYPDYERSVAEACISILEQPRERQGARIRAAEILGRIKTRKPGLDQRIVGALLSSARNAYGDKGDIEQARARRAAVRSIKRLVLRPAERYHALRSLVGPGHTPRWLSASLWSARASMSRGDR